MLMKRVIVCLDVQEGRVVKGVNFRGLRDVGNPVELAQRYEAEGADEIVFLDISAVLEGRHALIDVVRRTAEKLFIPLTVGGGVGVGSVGPPPPPSPQAASRINSGKRDVLFMPLFPSEIRASYLRPS